MEPSELIERFLAHQLELAGNGRVVRFRTDDAALMIEFENGHKLYLDSFGRGDGYNSELCIVGSDTFNPTDGDHSLDDEDVLDLIHHRC